MVEVVCWLSRALMYQQHLHVSGCPQRGTPINNVCWHCHHAGHTGGVWRFSTAARSYIFLGANCRTCAPLRSPSCHPRSPFFSSMFAWFCVAVSVVSWLFLRVFGCCNVPQVTPQGTSNAGHAHVSCSWPSLSKFASPLHVCGACRTLELNQLWPLLVIPLHGGIVACVGLLAEQVWALVAALLLPAEFRDRFQVSASLSHTVFFTESLADMYCATTNCVWACRAAA